MNRTKRDLQDEAKRKKFWAIVKTKKPRFYRALELAGDVDIRLLAVCASALVSIAMKEPEPPKFIKEVVEKKKRKPSAWSQLVGEYLRAGKTIQQAAEEWNKRKINKQ